LGKVISVDLPWPPSQNAIWRKNYRAKKGVYLNPKYGAWLTEAGWIVKAAKLPPLKGWFGATIMLTPPDKRKRDVDNSTKVLLDLAQKLGLVENDHLCRLLVAFYGPEGGKPGARLTLFPM
jgi:Holliday junction resolvase RusA-like endonuclease